MSLLDSDSKIIEKSQEKKATSGRKSGNAGLSRFKSLNRFGSLTEQYRKKEENQKPIANKPVQQVSSIIAETKEQPVTIKEKKIINAIEKVIEEVKPLESKKQKSTEQLTEPILSSNGDKTEIIQSSKREQTESIQVSNRVQKDFIQVSQQSSNRVQTESSKLDSNLDVRTLVGLQKDALNLFYILSKQQGSRVVGPITREEISKQLNKHKENVKTVLYRLCKKGFLIRVGSKEGRGGFLMLELPANVYQQLSMEESAGQQLQNISNLQSKLSSQQSSTGSSSSNSNLNINNNTTTNEIVTARLPDDWETIITPEVVKTIGFGKSHVRQIYKLGIISAEELQTSLNHFAHDLTNNAVKSTIGPLNKFMGIVRKGNPYISEAYVRELQKEDEELKALLNSYRTLQKKKTEEDLVGEFEEYYRGLSQEEIDMKIPPNQIAPSGSDMQKKVFQAMYIKDSLDKNNET